MVANGTDLTNQIVFSQIRGMEDTRLGHICITSSSYHFFNKIDFEQHRFKFLKWKYISLFASLQ